MDASPRAGDDSIICTTRRDERKQTHEHTRPCAGDVRSVAGELGRAQARDFDGRRPDGLADARADGGVRRLRRSAGAQPAPVLEEDRPVAGGPGRLAAAAGDAPARLARTEGSDGGAVAQGEAFFEARLKDTKLDDDHQSDVYATLAEGWRLVREWKKALQDYAEAHRLRKSARDKNFLRRVLPGEAEAAEKAKDYVRASTCWQRLIPLYGGEEADYKKRAQRNVQRLQPLVSRTSKVSADVMESDDAVDGISLDL